MITYEICVDLSMSFSQTLYIDKPNRIEANDMSNTVTREIPLSVTRAGKTYDVLIECRGEWTGENRPATRFDPAEIVEYTIYDMRFIEAEGLIDDVVAENSAESVDWLTSLPDTDYESLDVPVEIVRPGRPAIELEIIYERKTPLECFQLSARPHFIFSVEDYCASIISDVS